MILEKCNTLYLKFEKPLTKYLILLLTRIFYFTDQRGTCFCNMPLQTTEKVENSNSIGISHLLRTQNFLENTHWYALERMCFRGVGNVSFSEYFAYALNEWSHRTSSEFANNPLDTKLLELSLYNKFSEDFTSSNSLKKSILCKFKSATCSPSNIKEKIKMDYPDLLQTFRI